MTMTMTMTAWPQEIAEFFRSHHVMTLAASGAEGIWCASVFYHFDEHNRRLLFLTSKETRHGRMLAANERIAGTVAGQPAEITSIKGIQFTGRALLLEGFPGDEALSIYVQRFPFAQTFHAPIWAVAIDHVKLTDNARGFGHKLTWSSATGMDQARQMAEDQQ